MTEWETFGRYQLLKLVGTGGMAQVHLARQVGPDRFIKPCVLKRIAPEHQGNPVVRALFLEEARISALLNHPNVVSTFDFGQVDDVPYMAMEWVDGVNLAQLCKALARNDKWLAPGPAVDIVLAVLEALDYAHNLVDLDGRPLKLVHRDVSPQNVLISRRGAVKLADFGIARHEARETKTQGPTTKGKPGYMAPEQAMGTELDGRADLYAVGVMLTELISARRVMPKKDVVSILKIQDRVRALFELPRNVPRGIGELAVALTALEPEERPHSAREAAQRLRTAAQTLPQNTLGTVLSGIFESFLAGDQLPIEGGTPSAQSAPPLLSAEATEMMPAPPPAVTADLVFDEKSWAEQEEASGTAAAYEAKRPQALPEAGAIDESLVRRSSSMDAMQYFGAVHSEEAAQRGKLVLPLPPGAAARPNNAPPQKPMIPLRSEAIDSVIASAQDAVVIEPTVTPTKARIQPLLPLIGAALAVLLVGLGIMAAFTLRAPEVAPNRKGTLVIESYPPGARIFVDGKPTELTTPAELKDLLADEPHRVAVTRTGYLVVPKEAIAKAQAGGRTTLGFTLKKGRSFEIHSTPADAVVTVNGKKLTTPTPVTLEVLPYGETATITLQLDGHLPGVLRLKSVVGTPTVSEVQLKPGRELEIASEPPGAEVLVDGLALGKTPIYDVMVPENGSFSILVRKRGYKPWKKRLAARKLPEGPLVAELGPLPFLAMPMSNEERREAKLLDQKANRLQIDRKRTADKLKSAEQKLAEIEGSRQSFVGDVADAQRRVDGLRTHLDEVETELSEVQASIDAMRDTLQTRMEAEP